MKATQSFNQQPKCPGEVSEVSSEATQLSGDSFESRTLQSSRQVGLRNIGNTCYLSALLQCLKVFDSRDWGSVNAAVTGTSVRTSTMWEEYLRLVMCMKTGRKAVYAPYELKKAITQKYPGFNMTIQQDAHEMAMMLLESLTDEHAGDWGGKGWEHSTLGELCSTITCCSCQTSSPKKDGFNILSLEIPLTSQIVSITECLNQFEKEERLLRKDGWNCTTCNRGETAVKQLVLHKEPKDLILHLKRFGFNSGGRKISKEVIIQRIIELRATKYQLRGIVHHHGKSVSSGHYYAEVKEGDGWTIYDDESVSATVRSTERGSREAYILFYSQLR